MNTIKLKMACLIGILMMSYLSLCSKTTWSLRVGPSFSTFSFSDGASASYRTGFQLKVTGEDLIKNDLYSIFGYELTTKGHKETAEDGNVETTPMYFQFSWHIGYKSNLTESMRMVFHAGPYVAMGLAGKYKYDYTINSGPLHQSGTDEANFFGTGDGDINANRWDFGLGAGVGLEFSKILLDLGYDMGFINVFGGSDSAFPGASAYNRNFYLTIGYKF